MAPIKRKLPASSSIKKTEKLPRARRVLRHRPAHDQTALQHEPRRPARARRVRFVTESNNDPARSSLPSTSHPQSTQRGNVVAEEPSVETLIDHSKRKEREELLKRAVRSLNPRPNQAHNLPSPPESPQGERTGPSAKSGTVLDEQQNHMDPKARLLNSPHKATSPRQDAAGGVKPDVVMDDIPEQPEMPAAIERIMVEPGANIKMEEICTAFDLLKAQIQTHCREFYSYNKLSRTIPTFTYLKVKHPQLFRYIHYVADGSQYGWKKLLAVGPQRENLVYGIISRAIIAHVFDVELFGASLDDEETLLEMCRTYLHFDAFVRNVHRAEIIRRILHRGAADNFTADKNHSSYFSAAINTLERRINLLLEPLQQPKSSSSSLHLQKSLRSILQTSVRIHLATRLAGKNGTVYRFEHVHKYEHWDGQTMNCVNQRKMDLTAHHGETPLVKVACFPAVYATVPSGPNLENFVDPAFVEEWKMTADEHGSRPTITTFPITLADVVLENTPYDRSGFLTLSQTMAMEQAAMSDQKLLKLTGIDRVRNNRINKLVRRARKTVSGAAKGLGLATVAAAVWYLCKNREDAAPAMKRVLKSLKATVTPAKVIEVTTRTTLASTTSLPPMPMPPAAANTTPV